MATSRGHLRLVYGGPGDPGPRRGQGTTCGAEDIRNHYNEGYRPLREPADGFWLARWPRGRDVEAYVIYPTSIAVSREHRRAKTDRLNTELLMRGFVGRLRGREPLLQSIGG
jgi:hypothetical protein